MVSGEGYPGANTTWVSLKDVIREGEGVRISENLLTHGYSRGIFIQYCLSGGELFNLTVMYVSGK